MTDIDEQSEPLPPGIRAALDASRDELPPEAALRLAEARRAAVALADEVGEGASTPRWAGRSGLAAAGSALVLTLVVALVIGGREPADVMPLVSEPEIAAVQDLDVLEELEFLAWLEEEESRGAG